MDAYASGLIAGLVVGGGLFIFLALAGSDPQSPKSLQQAAGCVFNAVGWVILIFVGAMVGLVLVRGL